jgi:hypothetical protein
VALQKLSEKIGRIGVIFIRHRHAGDSGDIGYSDNFDTTMLLRRHRR